MDELIKTAESIDDFYKFFITKEFKDCLKTCGLDEKYLYSFIDSDGVFITKLSALYLTYHQKDLKKDITTVCFYLLCAFVPTPVLDKHIHDNLGNTKIFYIFEDILDERIKILDAIKLGNYADEVCIDLLGGNKIKSSNEKFNRYFYNIKYEYFISEINKVLAGIHRDRSAFKLGCDKEISYSNREMVLGKGADGIVFTLSSLDDKAVKYVKLNPQSNYSVSLIKRNDIANEIIINYRVNYIPSVAFLKDTRVTVCKSENIQACNSQNDEFCLFNKDERNINVYFIMEKIDGDIVKFHENIENDVRLLFILFQLAHGVACLQEAGISHCDLHRGNIFYKRSSKKYTINFKCKSVNVTMSTNVLIKIGDFSRARVNEEQDLPIVCDFSSKVFPIFEKHYGEYSNIFKHVKAKLASNFITDPFVLENLNKYGCIITPEKNNYLSSNLNAI